MPMAIKVSKRIRTLRAALAKAANESEPTAEKSAKSKTPKSK